MKTSNKLLLAAFLLVLIIVVALNLMLKNEILTLKNESSTTENLAPGFVKKTETVIIMNSNAVEDLEHDKKSADLKDFKIVLERTGNGVKMKSLQGSAWNKLSFNLNNNQFQAVDEYGMTDLNQVNTEKNADLTDFLFTITKTKNTIILKGIEGTAWTNLSFTLAENEKQAFDQFGLTKPE